MIHVVVIMEKKNIGMQWDCIHLW